MSEATAAQIERREPLMKIRGLTKEFKIKAVNWAPSLKSCMR